jgi:sporulation protein YlmC with PRC-barrel domain
MRHVELREMLGRPVVDSEGVHIGRIEEIEAERGDDYCVVTSYLVEHRGLLDRVSTWTLSASLRSRLARRASSQPYRVAWDEMDISDPGHPRTLVPKEKLRRS